MWREAQLNIEFRPGQFSGLLLTFLKQHANDFEKLNFSNKFLYSKVAPLRLSVRNTKKLIEEGDDTHIDEFVSATNVAQSYSMKDFTAPHVRVIHRFTCVEARQLTPQQKCLIPNFKISQLKLWIATILFLHIESPEDERAEVFFNLLAPQQVESLNRMFILAQSG